MHTCLDVEGYLDPPELNLELSMSYGKKPLRLVLPVARLSLRGWLAWGVSSARHHPRQT